MIRIISVDHLKDFNVQRKSKYFHSLLMIILNFGAMTGYIITIMHGMDHFTGAGKFIVLFSGLLLLVCMFYLFKLHR